MCGASGHIQGGPAIQQTTEAEDDQHTQVCELEIKNISSTVFIL